MSKSCSEFCLGLPAAMRGLWFQVFCVADGSHFAMLLTEQHFWSVDQLHQNHSRFAFGCLFMNRVLSLFKLPASWSEARKRETKGEREIPCRGSTEGILNCPDFLGQWPWNSIYQVKYTFYNMLCSSWLYLKDSYHHVVRKNLALVVEMVLEVLGNSEKVH